MIRAKVLLIFIILNGLLLTASLAVAFYTHRAAGRYLVSNTLAIIPYNHFDAADAATAEQNNITITKGDRQVSSIAIFCNPAYFDIHFMHFIEGGPWHIVENQSQLVILNEALAWYLFGGADITGLTVEIDSTFFQIIGVVRQSAEYMAWLPNGSRNQPPTSLYLHRDYYAPIPEQIYTSIDVNRYIESISQRFRILFYMMLLYLLAIFVQKAKATPHWWIGVAVCLTMFININDFILWLPNLSGGIAVVFSDLTNIGVLPPERYLSYGLRQIGRLNSFANYAWVVGLIGVINLFFVGGMVKDT